MPVKTRDVPPVYPAIAQSARVQGVVIVEAVVGVDGKVSSAKVVRSIPLLDQAALDAIRQWEFAPTLVNGVPTPVILTTTVNFVLPTEAGGQPTPGSTPGAAAPAASARGRGDGSASPSATGLSQAIRNLQKYVQEQSFTDSTNNSSASIQFDSDGVEFGPWIRRFVAQVRGNWFVPEAAATTRGRVVVAFAIMKDGRITDLKVVEPSTIVVFDMAALRAVAQSNPTLPLPNEYRRDRVSMTVTFHYNERTQPR